MNPWRSLREAAALCGVPALDQVYQKLAMAEIQVRGFLIVGDGVFDAGKTQAAASRCGVLCTTLSVAGQGSRRHDWLVTHPELVVPELVLAGAFDPSNN